MEKICVFASGEGTNAGNIIDYFKKKGTATVALVVTNKPQSGVIARAEKAGVPVWICPPADFGPESLLGEKLKKEGISLIVLAGFLRLIPENLLKAFPGRIINIHPSLLPKFGGKGMYGQHVHQAVLASGEKESGITIHYVSERYDEGAIIRQERIPIDQAETLQSLEEKIHRLEHLHYPAVIESVLNRS